MVQNEIGDFMILLKLGILFFLISITYLYLGKVNFSTWNVFDLLLFCILLFLSFFTLTEEISFFIILILSLGCILFRMMMEEIKQIKLFSIKKPVVIIKNGVLNFRELTQLSYSFEKLMYDLEKIGVTSIDEVGIAVLKGKKLLCIKK